MATTKLNYSQVLLNAPRGFLINGKITPSVASNNLTVAIKTLAGNDPSAADPVIVRIGDTVRSITSALSVTKNAGTNWFNSGSSELATKETDYFVYLGYNATDGIVIGFSRIPYGTEYDSFSATSTNDKYCAISTITNAAAGDDYELIGRFAATLSASAAYTWTVPTFTNKNLIQRPIYETRSLQFAPTVGGFTGSPTVGFSYKVLNTSVYYSFDIQGTSNATTFTITLPFTLSGYHLVGWVSDNGSFQVHPGLLEPSGTYGVNVYKDGGVTAFTNANGKRIIAKFTDSLI